MGLIVVGIGSRTWCRGLGRSRPTRGSAYSGLLVRRKMPIGGADAGSRKPLVARCRGRRGERDDLQLFHRPSLDTSLSEPFSHGSVALWAHPLSSADPQDVVGHDANVSTREIGDDDRQVLVGHVLIEVGQQRQVVRVSNAVRESPLKQLPCGKQMSRDHSTTNAVAGGVPSTAGEGAG